MGKQKFWTGLYTQGEEPFQSATPYNGAGWTADFEEPQRTPNIIKDGKEIVLIASSWASAQRALNLILACHQLLMGEREVFLIDQIAYNDSEPIWMENELRSVLKERHIGRYHFPLACAVAAKASRRRIWVYAIAEYRFSMSQYSEHNVDMEPWSAPHLPINSFPENHVLLSHAIMAAYAVIENLGLHVKASKEKPSMIKGLWNPQVKQDLEERISAAGINTSETLLWKIRGPKRRIEVCRPLPQGDKASWSYGMVRDTKIPLIDAIAYASWLRSRVAAHAVSSLTSGLSPYDVSNVQHVARRLLLEMLGFWRLGK